MSLEYSLKNASAPSWRQEMAQSYTTLAQLEADQLISAKQRLLLEPVVGHYPLRISRYYAGLFGQDDSCPIRAQALPSCDELATPLLPYWAQQWCQQAFARDNPWDEDPIGDTRFWVAARLTHRYRHRALLHCSSVCGIACRFCFRKSHLHSRTPALYDGSFDEALAYIREHRDIVEVILTGGDPLTRSEAALAPLLRALEQIDHLQHLRLHTRMTVSLPSRITPALTALLSQRRLLVSVVSHFNHPRELSEQALLALQRLRQAGIPLYNQTVLMHRINDRVQTLFDLFQQLYHQGVTPFYLHHLDYVPGSFHLRVPIRQGLYLMQQLAGVLSGPALPHYVVDLPTGGGKVRLEQALQPLRCHNDSKIAGALYALSSVSLRSADRGRVHLYADLAPAAVRQSTMS